MKMIPSYRSIWLTALVTGVFSLLVCALMLVDFARRTASLPLDSPQFVILKERLEREGGNDTAEKQLRALDAKLRGEYFRQRRFTIQGAYLLFGGLAATVLLAHWAATLRRRLPAPIYEATDQDDPWRQSQLGQWAVGALALIVVLATFGSRLFAPSVLPRSLAELESQIQPAARTAEVSTNATAGPASSVSSSVVPRQPQACGGTTDGRGDRSQLAPVPRSSRSRRIEVRGRSRYMERYFG